MAVESAKDGFKEAAKVSEEIIRKIVGEQEKYKV